MLRVSYQREGDRFGVEYEGGAERLPGIIAAVNRTVILPEARRRLGKEK